jgi:hypothetical protein
MGILVRLSLRGNLVLGLALLHGPKHFLQSKASAGLSLDLRSPALSALPLTSALCSSLGHRSADGF